MDYTKDAVLIHEGLHSFEDDDKEGEDEGEMVVHPSNQFDMISIVTLTNGSEMIGQKVMTKMNEPDLEGVVKGNRSFLLPSSMEEYGNEYNDTYIPMSMRPETYIVPVLFAIIFIIGVIGNGTLIAIFIKHRFMRNVPNMFIVSLAVGDLLVILFCVPFTSTLYTVDSWPYGLAVCKFSEFVKDLSVGVSVFTLTALSADRYFAIVDPMRKLTGRRATKITIVSIIGIWALSILVALPSALFSYIRIFPEEGDEEIENSDGRTFAVCYPYPTEFTKTYAQVMVMFHFLVFYAIPLLFIATFYIIMARHLVLSTRNMPGEAQGQVKQIQARKKVAKMILSFVVIFAICFFPHHLFLLFFYFYPDSENSFNAFWNICRILGFCLSFMNSCINPITLYCVSGTFRKQFNEHLFCCLCPKTGSRTSRGGHISMGGTQAGGNDAIGGNRSPGLCAACVSGNNGGENGHGTPNRSGHGRVHRGSTWESSDRLMSKRKSTWDTQTTMVNHRVVNLSAGALNGPANIHVNLCENIPLTNMRGSVHQHQRQTTSTSSPRGTMMKTKVVENDGDHHRNHQQCYSAKAYNSHGQARKSSFSERGDEQKKPQTQHLSHKLSLKQSQPKIEEEMSSTGTSSSSAANDIHLTEQQNCQRSMRNKINLSKSFFKNEGNSGNYWVSPTKETCSSSSDDMSQNNNNDYPGKRRHGERINENGITGEKMVGQVEFAEKCFISPQDSSVILHNPLGGNLGKGRTLVCYN